MKVSTFHYNTISKERKSDSLCLSINLLRLELYRRKFSTKEKGICDAAKKICIVAKKIYTVASQSFSYRVKLQLTVNLL